MGSRRFKFLENQIYLGAQAYQRNRLDKQKRNYLIRHMAGIAEILWSYSLRYDKLQQDLDDS